MMELHVCDHSGSLLRAFALGDEAEVIVGRDETCDVQIRSGCVSREHCAIERDGDGHILRDLDSKAGTLVMGTKINQIRVQDGLEVGVGPALLRFIDIL